MNKFHVITDKEAPEYLHVIVQGVEIQIKNEEEGIVLDAYPEEETVGESGDPITTSWAFNSDAEAELENLAEEKPWGLAPPEDDKEFHVGYRAEEEDKLIKYEEASDETHEKATAIHVHIKKFHVVIMVEEESIQADVYVRDMKDSRILTGIEVYFKDL